MMRSAREFRRSGGLDYHRGGKKSQRRTRQPRPGSEPAQVTPGGFVKVKPTADQRAAVSKEFAKILHNKIGEINRRFQVRRTGLALDVDRSTQQRYINVAPKLAAHNGRSRHRSGGASQQRRNSGVTQHPESHPGSHSGQGEGAAVAESGQASPVLARMARRASVGAMDVAGHSEKAKELASMQAFLHEAESKLMGRMVEGFTFHVSRQGELREAFQLPLLRIMRYVALVIRCPYSEAHFRRCMREPRSCEMLRNLFWFTHCYCFQKDSQLLQERLLANISREYVGLLSVVTTNKDYFFETFPYAMAFAVCACFHHFVPGSRSRYTPAWRLQVFVLVCRVLCGMDVCAVTVQRMQETLFPDEGPGYAKRDGAIKATRLRRKQPALPLNGSLSVPAGGWESLPGPSWDARLGALKQLPQELALPSLDQNKLVLSGPGGREPNPPKVPKGEEDSVSVSSEGDEAAAPPPEVMGKAQGRQLRLSFSASSLSTLVQRFLNTDMAGSKRTVTLKRTAPVPWVKVGGVDTFQPATLRTELHGLQARHRAMLRESRQKTLQERKELLATTNAIQEQATAVAEGGVAVVSKFCLDLSDSKADKLKAQRSRSRPQRHGGRGDDDSSARASRYRSQREERLAAHLNSLPSPNALTIATSGGRQGERGSPGRRGSTLASPSTEFQA